MKSMHDTIAAIATAVGRGAIGIVRMSGPESLIILSKLWISSTHSVEKFATHRLYLGKISKLSTGMVIDKVLAAYMKAPHSYTGEDIVEISCHGGSQVLQMILGELLGAGARMAEPGEFTKRAFLNGKLDLAQAEAVAALIDSSSAISAKLAEEQLEGRLSERIKEQREKLKKITAFVEATIDFPEEDTEFIGDGDILTGVNQLISDLRALKESYKEGRIFRDGVKAVIAGPPNAGKSSLLNRLLGFERAIVHNQPGTTRDTIEEETIIDGIKYRFIDTAGIREAEAEVEEIGVEKSKKALSMAEVVLLVLDGNDFCGIDKKFVGELKDVEHVVVVINKSDLGLKLTDQKVNELFGKRATYKISAKNGEGIRELCQGLTKEILGGKKHKESESIIISSKRHFDAIRRAIENLLSAKKSISAKESAEFTSHHLRQALDNLGEIIGEVTTEDLLKEVFNNFCIGK